MILPDVLKVHSDGTDVAGIAKIDRANLDNLEYLVTALLFHQVRMMTSPWNSSVSAWRYPSSSLSGVVVGRSRCAFEVLLLGTGT